MKAFVFCLMSFVLAVAANAQGLQPRRGGLLNRSARPATASQSAQTPQASQTSAAAAADAGGRSIEFNAAPLEMVFTVYQDLVGKTVLKDPQTPAATITLQPKKGQELTNEDKIEAIETVLEMNGIHMEPYGEKFVRALKRDGVKQNGIPLVLDPEQEIEDNARVISSIVKPQYLPLEEAQEIIKEFVSKEGKIQGFARAGTILVTDSAMNVRRIRQIIKEIDIKDPPMTQKKYERTLKYQSAENIAAALQKCVEYSKMEEQERKGEESSKNKQRPLSAASHTPVPSPLGRLNRNQPQNQGKAQPDEATLVSVMMQNRSLVRGTPLFLYDTENAWNKILIHTYPENMELFDWIIEQLDVSPIQEMDVKVYRLKYAEAEDVSDMINDILDKTTSSRSSNKTANKAQPAAAAGGKSQPATTASRPVSQRSGEPRVGEINKETTTVLADKRINGLVVMALTKDLPTIEQIIESMDIKLSQVLIETTIIEVQLGDELKTGMDWVQKGRQNKLTVGQEMKDSLGRQLFYPFMKDENGNFTSFINYDGIPQLEGTEGVSTVKAVKNVKELIRKGLLNNYGGATSVGLAGGANNGASAWGIANGNYQAMDEGSKLTKPFTFVFDSDELGLSAILEASKTDSHYKYVASPVVMTLDNKEAVVNATKMNYILKGFTSSGNSYSTIATPDYEQKELGIELKITPKINPNGTVMLTVEEKYTQIGDDQTIQYVASNSARDDSEIKKTAEALTGNGDSTTSGSLQNVQVPTTITREMSADVLLEDRQTVVFGGLTETRTKSSESGIPILKDIPIIGKWLFGSVEQSESRTELLVFMTPYVLDDAQAAQVEALRRKKTMSDPRPWEDHGWSLSPLADPVSKREQMRRIKDEWRIQDEERRTKIAIEKAKVDRVKQLEKMSKEERELWLKMHKAELDEEAQDELEEKMLDKESQEELKKLAAEVRAKKLGAAEKAIKQAEAEAAAENERGKLDAAKKGE